MTAAPETLIRASVALSCLLVGLAGWRLLPRLPRAFAGLAAVMLAAQILVIAVALEFQPASPNAQYLWDFEEEWNIPAALASLLMALIGGVALLTAWLGRARHKWWALYHGGLGLLFLFFAGYRALERPDAAPQGRAYFRQPPCAEDQQDDGQDNQQFGQAERSNSHYAPCLWDGFPPARE